MSLTTDILCMVRGHRDANRTPIRIEIGKWQAETLAEEWPIEIDPEHGDVSPADIVYAGGLLWGLPLVGVGTDHLAVVAQDADA